MEKHAACLHSDVPACRLLAAVPWTCGSFIVVSRHVNRAPEDLCTAEYARPVARGKAVLDHLGGHIGSLKGARA